MFVRRVLPAGNRCGGHFGVRRWMCSPDKLSTRIETASAALKLFNEGWKTWSMGKEQKSSPALPIDIQKPFVGKKQVPKGQSPMPYLRGLPELQGYSVDHADVSYWCPARQADIKVSCADDWKAYFETSSAGKAPELVVQCPWSLKMKARQVVAQLSGKHREILKNLFASKDTKNKEIEECMVKLNETGYSHFQTDGFVQEELGYTVEDFQEIVDDLVNAGLPETFGRGLKRAAKAKGGSNKAIRSMTVENGVRTMLYMKFQVSPNEHELVDALIAIYRVNAVDPTQGQTNIESEQAFKRFVELDAERTWRSEVQQFLDPSSDASS